MSINKEYNFGQKPGRPFGSFGGIIILTLFFVALYFIAKGLFTVLSFVAPVLLILTLIIDYTVVIDYGKFVLNLLKNNIIVGILAVILTVLGFPIVSGFLFFRALLRNKLKSAIKQQEKKNAFVEYEVVDEETENEDFLELPDVQKSPKPQDGDYEDLFK
jgi:hypothetical protein